MASRSSILNKAAAGQPESYGSCENTGSDGPSKVICHSADGKDKEINVNPKFLCGMLERPPGGWHGPFGFLRLVAVAFLLLSITGIVCLVMAILELSKGGGVINVLSAALLIVASVMASVAAYAHEGLANQVSMAAKQNGRFSALNDDFEGQLGQLSGVTDALNEWAVRGEDTYNHLLKTISGLQRVAALAKVNTIIRAFTDAELHHAEQVRGKSVRPNRCLESEDEVNAFFAGCADILKVSIPELDVDDLRLLCIKSGCVGLTVTSLIIAAVLCSSDTDHDMMRATGLMALVRFILEPKCPERYAEVLAHLSIMLKHATEFNTEAAIHQELKRMEHAASISSGTRVPEADATPLVKVVLATRHRQPEATDQVSEVSSDDSSDERDAS